jgi:hypothetical protein
LAILFRSFGLLVTLVGYPVSVLWFTGSLSWLSCFGTLVYFAIPKTFKLFGFRNIWLWHKLSVWLFNEHSYLLWVQLAPWIQRRKLKTDNTLFEPLGLLFLLHPINNKKHNSNEHSYQVWFHIGLVVLDKDSKRTTPFSTPLGLYFRGPSIEQSYQVCLQLAMWYQRWKIKANNTLFSQLWASCFFCVFPINKENLSRGSSNQVWFQFAKWLQRRRLECKSLLTTTTTTDAKINK